MAVAGIAVSEEEMMRLNKWQQLALAVGAVVFVGLVLMDAAPPHQLLGVVLATAAAVYIFKD